MNRITADTARENTVQYIESCFKSERFLQNVYDEISSKSQKGECSHMINIVGFDSGVKGIIGKIIKGEFEPLGYKVWSPTSDIVEIVW